jgi:hypothetical protein
MACTAALDAPRLQSQDRTSRRAHSGRSGRQSCARTHCPRSPSPRPSPLAAGCTASASLEQHCCWHRQHGCAATWRACRSRSGRSAWRRAPPGHALCALVSLPANAASPLPLTCMTANAAPSAHTSAAARRARPHGLADVAAGVGAAALCEAEGHGLARLALQCRLVRQQVGGGEAARLRRVSRRRHGEEWARQLRREREMRESRTTGERRTRTPLGGAGVSPQARRRCVACAGRRGASRVASSCAASSPSAPDLAALRALLPHPWCWHQRSRRSLSCRDKGDARQRSSGRLPLIIFTPAASKQPAAGPASPRHRVLRCTCFGARGQRRHGHSVPDEGRLAAIESGRSSPCRSGRCRRREQRRRRSSIVRPPAGVTSCPPP